MFLPVLHHALHHSNQKVLFCASFVRVIFPSHTRSYQIILMFLQLKKKKNNSALVSQLQVVQIFVDFFPLFKHFKNFFFRYTFLSIFQQCFKTWLFSIINTCFPQYTPIKIKIKLVSAIDFGKLVSRTLLGLHCSLYKPWGTFLSITVSSPDLNLRQVYIRVYTVDHFAFAEPPQTNVKIEQLIRSIYSLRNSYYPTDVHDVWKL